MAARKLVAGVVPARVIVAIELQDAFGDLKTSIEQTSERVAVSDPDFCRSE